MTVEITNAECMAHLHTLPADSYHACICDPPYGLSKEPDIREVLTHWLAGDAYTHGGSGFMGKSWDSFVPGPELWREVFRVLKPGAYLMAFASTRTADLMSVSIRLAGFECHPFIAWVFGSGFPKATNLGKQIDKEAGVTREITRERMGDVGMKSGKFKSEHTKTSQGVIDQKENPVTEAAQQWDGYFYGKQSLKPALEPILFFQKPFEKRLSGAQNAIKWGCGAINVDRCRVGTEDTRQRTGGAIEGSGWGTKEGAVSGSEIGRFPANLIHDGSLKTMAAFAEYGERGSGNGLETIRNQRLGSGGNAKGAATFTHGDTGTIACFFYCAKASRSEREAGIDGMPIKQMSHDGREMPIENAYQRNESRVRNFHPTIKPLALTEYLAKLLLPPPLSDPRKLLVPFSGVGSECIGAMFAGWDEITGIELESEYVAIAQRRIEWARECIRQGKPFFAPDGPEVAGAEQIQGQQFMDL